MAEHENGRGERLREKVSERRRERSPDRFSRGERREKDERDSMRRRSDGRFQDDRFDRRGNRDREQKRRKSLSPSRHSPRSPPQKRSAFESRDRSRGYGSDERNQYQQDFHRRATGFDVPAPAVGGSFGASTTTRSSGGMMTYKQFMLELEDDISPTEAERKYAEYKADFMNNQKLAYFSEHKDEDWLREKYDPERLGSLVARRKEKAQTASKAFMELMLQNRLDLGPSAVMTTDVEMDGEDHPRRRQQSDSRYNREKDESYAPKVSTSAESPTRVSHDINRALALVRKLDFEKEITENSFLAGINNDAGANENMTAVTVNIGQKALKGLELLDTLATYLWRVHGLDYYGGMESKGFARGLRTIRVPKGGRSEEENGKLMSNNWEKKVDDVWERRLGDSGVDPVVAMLGVDRLEKGLTNALDKWVRKIKDEKYGWKYGCGSKGCTKLFHGPEFVLKHLKLKHVEILKEAEKEVMEAIYKENFLNDPEAPVNSLTTASIRASKREPPIGGPRHVATIDNGPPNRDRAPPVQERLGPRSDALLPTPTHGAIPTVDPLLGDRERFDRPYVAERLPLDPRSVERDHSRDRSERFDHHLGGDGGGALYPYRRVGSGGIHGVQEGERFKSRGGEGMEGELRGFGSRGMRSFEPLDQEGRGDVYPGMLERGPLPPFDERVPFNGPGGGLEAPPFFEPFEGGPPFGGGMDPPQMLIPVPGAGPLGPFVPAPPEVAMRMMREQQQRGGGPPVFFDDFETQPPFEGPLFEEQGLEGSPLLDSRGGGPGWGLRGRGPRDGLSSVGRKVGGPFPAGSPPFLGAPQGMRPDPRNVRSYKDLDAPEDEVTVIDYRSL